MWLWSPNPSNHNHILLFSQVFHFLPIIPFLSFKGFSDQKKETLDCHQPSHPTTKRVYLNIDFNQTEPT